VWRIHVTIALERATLTNVTSGIHPHPVCPDGKTLSADGSTALNDHWSTGRYINPVSRLAQAPIPPLVTPRQSLRDRQKNVAVNMPAPGVKAVPPGINIIKTDQNRVALCGQPHPVVGLSCT
jgi:hypothetical protein